LTPHKFYRNAINRGLRRLWTFSEKYYVTHRILFAASKKRIRTLLGSMKPLKTPLRFGRAKIRNTQFILFYTHKHASDIPLYATCCLSLLRYCGIFFCGSLSGACHTTVAFMMMRFLGGIFIGIGHGCEENDVIELW
jgi:hypothetical protein